MRKIYKFLVLAIITLAMFAAFEVQMDNSSEKESVTKEKTAFLPPKSTICLPPRG